MPCAIARSEPLGDLGAEHAWRADCHRVHAQRAGQREAAGVVLLVGQVADERRDRIFRAVDLQPLVTQVDQAIARNLRVRRDRRSEEHTSELQSLMRLSYTVSCLKKKKIK